MKKRGKRRALIKRVCSKASALVLSASQYSTSSADSEVANASTVAAATAASSSATSTASNSGPARPPRLVPKSRSLIVRMPSVNSEEEEQSNDVRKTGKRRPERQQRHRRHQRQRRQRRGSTEDDFDLLTAEAVQPRRAEPAVGRSRAYLNRWAKYKKSRTLSDLRIVM